MCLRIKLMSDNIDFGHFHVDVAVTEKRIFSHIYIYICIVSQMDEDSIERSQLSNTHTHTHIQNELQNYSTASACVRMCIFN